MVMGVVVVILVVGVLVVVGGMLVIGVVVLQSVVGSFVLVNGVKGVGVVVSGVGVVGVVVGSGGWWFLIISMFGFVEGGQVCGFGILISDSILVWFLDQEVVIRVVVVIQLGMILLFLDINKCGWVVLYDWFGVVWYVMGGIVSIFVFVMFVLGLVVLCL